VWSGLDLIGGDAVPFPSVADIGFLGSVPLAVAALLLFPAAPARRRHRVGEVLDGCLVATSVLFVSWVAVLAPLSRTYRGGSWKEVLALTYPVGDIVLLSLVTILVARAAAQERTSLGLVMAGLVCFALADSGFTYSTVVDNPNLGLWLDTGWVAGYALIGLGAWWSILRPDEAAPTDEPSSTVSLVAPYVPVLVVLAATAVEILGHRHLGRAAWLMAMVVVILALVREALRAWDQVRGATALAAGPSAGGRTDGIGGRPDATRGGGRPWSGPNP